MTDERGDYAVLISLSMREEAEVAAAALRADGIDAFIGNSNHAHTNWGYIIALGGLQILVPSAKLGEARQLLHDRVRNRPSDDEPVQRRDRYKMWLVIAGYFLFAWWAQIVNSEIARSASL